MTHRNVLGTPRNDLGEIIAEDMTTRNVLEKQLPDTFKTSTTPNIIDVQNRKFIVLLNTGAITITDFENGSSGQRIYLLGDGFTTLQHGTSIYTNTGANKLLAANKVYKFTLFKPDKTVAHKWVEDE